jgi:hypothetical protein
VLLEVREMLVHDGDHVALETVDLEEPREVHALEHSLAHRVGLGRVDTELGRANRPRNTSHQRWCMAPTDLPLMFQALSATAIAGGLVYTALQFRKAREAQHFANFSKLVEMQMHLREMRVGDPSLARVYRGDVAFAEDLPTPEARDRAIREYFFNLMQLSVFEIVWFGWKRGQIPEDYFRSWESRMHEIVAERSFQDMWNSPSMKFMHDEFHRYMAGMVAGGAGGGKGAARAQK